MNLLFTVEPTAAWAAVILFGLMIVVALTPSGKGASRWLVSAPAPPRVTGAVLIVAQALCVVPAAWHIWLCEASRREAIAGHNEEVIFAAIGDRVVMFVVMGLGSRGPTLRFRGSE